MDWPPLDDLRACYDRLGSRSDEPWWYGDVATAALAQRAGFERAAAVFELG